MMRFASHFILHKEQLFRMHYAELSDDGSLVGIHPFTEELAHTAFFDGLIVLEASSKFSTDDSSSYRNVERFGSFSAIRIIRYKEAIAD